MHLTWLRVHLSDEQMVFTDSLQVSCLGRLLRNQLPDLKFGEALPHVGCWLSDMQLVSGEAGEMQNR